MHHSLLQEVDRPVSHAPAPATRSRRSRAKVTTPLAVLVITAGLTGSALSTASAAPILPGDHSVVAMDEPVINTAPEDVTATSGEFVYFAASSSDSEAFQQWQVSEDGGETFADIVGANSTFLELDSVNYAQNGFKYRAFFTNADGTAYTDAATLTVLASPPQVTADPESVQVASGAPFAFTASAEATRPRASSGRSARGTTRSRTSLGQPPASTPAPRRPPLTLAGASERCSPTRTTPRVLPGPP